MKLDLEKVNKQLGEMRASQIILWATEQFQTGITMMTSCGSDSAVMLQLVTKNIPDIPVIFVDTGYHFPETYRFAIELQDRFGLNLKVCSNKEMTPEQMELEYGKLWEQGEDGLHRYNQIRKVAPLNESLARFNVTALFSGIRFDQTNNRAEKSIIEIGEDGIYRIHPILKWDQRAIQRFMKFYKLPRHPLVVQGYESIGDWHCTLPGEGRNGRNLGDKSECGLHDLPDYRI